jgi:cell division protein FtsI (penicillin-binding protein 3)
MNNVHVNNYPSRDFISITRRYRFVRCHARIRQEIDTTVIIKLFLVAVGLLFSSRLSGLQLVKYTELKSFAHRQQIANVEVAQVRRTIIDREGKILAIDLPAYDVYVHPRMFSLSFSRMAESLSPILELSVPYLENRFHEGASGICLVHQLNATKSTQVRRLRLDGIELVKHPQRVYPQRGSLGTLIGYVDTEGNGQAGIESSLEQLLKPNYQDFPCWMDGNGNFLGNRFPKPILFHEASVIQLTIDSGLQEKVSQIMINAKNRFQAKRVAGIIMEAHTGAIRALVASPSYDPNSYPWFPVERFRCWPITDLFEPGSTFKPINLAIALENGILYPTDRILDTGNIRVGDSWIRNVGGGLVWDNTPDHLTPTQILQRSSNVGMVRIMQALDPEIYHRNLMHLCLGTESSYETSGSEPSWSQQHDLLVSDLASEYTVSVIKDKHEFVDHEIETATAAFGHGLAMTPMKLLQLIAAIANGGMSVKPHLVSSLISPNTLENFWQNNSFTSEPSDSSYKHSTNQKNWQGNRKGLYFSHIPVPSLELGWFDMKQIPQHARERKRLFSPQTCHVLLGMLERVVLDSQATGSRCFIPGYSIAGKTGTAQKPSSSGGYLSDSVVTSFVGMYPAYQPQFVTLVMIDEPEEPFQFAFNTAADVTQAIISEIIIKEGDAPSYPTVSCIERHL